MTRPSAAVVLMFALASGCYTTHVRDGDPPPRVDGSLLDARVASPDDAGPLDAGRLCGCPGDPAAEVCRLPEMCCPATRTCENPASFRCTGSAPSCD
ncbi:MAG: hypothetical protein M3Y87_30450 [Myxococcota bacterium]|nr:hypothetical protein [Myxococcota bacterium]